MEDLHTVDIREPEVENNHSGRVDGRVGKTGVTGRGGTDLMAKGTLSDAAWRQQCGVSPSLTRTVAISVLLGQVCSNTEGEAESGAASGDVIDPDPLAVRVAEGLGDRQSQVGAGVGFAAKEEAEDLYSRSGRGRSSTSNVDSSNNRRIYRPRSRAWARARFIPATTRATGSMTAA